MLRKLMLVPNQQKISNSIIGKITKGTNDVNTVTVNSSAKMFPNNRKLSDKGFVKSSKILIGRKWNWLNMFKVAQFYLDLHRSKQMMLVMLTQPLY
jgi:hypothetical protein